MITPPWLSLSNNAPPTITLLLSSAIYAAQEDQYRLVGRIITTRRDASPVINSLESDLK